QRDIGGLQRCVAGFEQSTQAFAFNHSNRLLNHKNVLLRVTGRYFGLVLTSPRNDLSKSSCGLARICELTSSPTLPAALAPASTAALTLPTSPLHSTVINPPPMGIVFTRLTLAALTIASLASTLPT